MRRARHIYVHPRRAALLLSSIPTLVLLQLMVPVLVHKILLLGGQKVLPDEGRRAGRLRVAAIGDGILHVGDGGFEFRQVELGAVGERPDEVTG